MKSSFLGSAVGVLLVFSAISYSKTFISDQNRNQPQQAQISPQQPGSASATTQTGTELVKPDVKASNAAAGDAVPSDSRTSLIRPRIITEAPATDGTARLVDTIAAPTQTYTATAYCLRGRTASGKLVSRGLIAADPAFLPLGSRVRLDAGSFSGEYLVADTGGAVKGRHIDIWTPTSREAMKFGRRAVKLTVLTFGVRRARHSGLRSKRK